MKIEPGMTVMTKWDDFVKPLKALVLLVYRGHREKKAIVLLDKTNTIEKIVLSQVVRVCKEKTYMFSHERDTGSSLIIQK